MKNRSSNATRVYLICLMLFWLVFGLITTFDPPLMDLFQTPAGVAAKTAFSDLVWRHDGLDIIAVCILLFALLQQKAISAGMIRATAFATLMPAIAIAYSLLATPYWNVLFTGAGAACLAFVIWGFILAGGKTDAVA